MSGDPRHPPKVAATAALRQRNAPVRFRPMKPRRHGTPKAAVAEAYAEVGDLARVATLLGLSVSQAHAYSDPEAAAELPWRQACALTVGGSTALAEHLAGLAGCLLLRPPPADAEGWHALSAEAMAAFGEAMAALVAGLADGRLDAAEARGALKETDDVLRVLTALRGRLAEAAEGEG